jgi:hypothetical protein
MRIKFTIRKEDDIIYLNAVNENNELLKTFIILTKEIKLVGEDLLLEDGFLDIDYPPQLNEQSGNFISVGINISGNYFYDELKFIDNDRFTKAWEDMQNHVNRKMFANIISKLASESKKSQDKDIVDLCNKHGLDIDGVKDIINLILKKIKK